MPVCARSVAYPAWRRRFNDCNQLAVGVSHRRLEWQTFAGIALAVHTYPSPVTVWPLAIEAARAWAVLPAAWRQISVGVPRELPAISSVRGFAGLLTSSVCPLAFHSE